jgi:hypothetical protein
MPTVGNGTMRAAARVLVLMLQIPAWADRAAAGPAVWLAPVDDMVTPAGFQVDQDYQQLFQDDAPWRHALSHLGAFEMVRRYVTTQPEPNLQRIFSFLHDHNVALGVTFGMVPARSCGDGVEGTAHRPDENTLTARRLKRLGADVKYIVMDEPLTFGHFFHGKNACAYTMEELAAGIAGEINKVRDVFPNIPVVDVEAGSGVGTPAELGQWLDTLKKVLGDGAPISVRFDIQWELRSMPWQEITPPLVTAVLQHGYRYGIIFDGTPGDRSSEEWIRTAEGHIKAWEATVKAPPDHVMIQSWHRFPETVLPETKPVTLTYLVNWYCDNAAIAKGCK